MAEKNTKMTFADYAKEFAKTRKNDNILRKSSLIPQYVRVNSLCPGIAYPTWGGLPHGGRIIEISGLNSSGKTSGMSAIIADYLRNYPDKSVLYVDAENTYDVEYQSRANSFDPEKLYIYNPDVGESGEIILGTLLDMANNISDLSLIIIDSVPALVPSIDYENEFEKDNGMRGTLAKFLYKWQREIIPTLKANDIDLAFINQTRVKGQTYTGADILDEPCGDAIKFYASVRIRFGRRKFLDANGDELTNSNKTYYGAMTMRQALARSRNIPAVQAFMAVDKTKVAEFVHNLGIDYYQYDSNGNVKDTNLYESYAIGGGVDVSPLDMAAAYSSFGRQGYYIEPYSYTKIVFKETDEVYEHKYEKVKAMSEETAYMITDILLTATKQGAIGNVNISGTEVAGKTGTSTHSLKNVPDSASSDNWVISYSPDYTLAFWYGVDVLGPKNYTNAIAASVQRKEISVN